MAKRKKTKSEQLDRWLLEVEDSIEEDDIGVDDEAPEDPHAAFIATLSRKVQQNFEKSSPRFEGDPFHLLKGMLR